MLRLTGFLLLVCFLQTIPSIGQDVSSLLKKLESTKEDSAKIPLYIDLSALCDLQDIPTYTKAGLILVEKEIGKNPSSKYHLNQKAELMSNEAFYYGEKGDTTKQDSISRITLMIHHKTGNRKGKAAVLNNMGYSYTTRANYLKAIQCYSKSLEILIQLKDHKGLALRYNNIGDIYLRIGMYNQALENMLKSLHAYEKLKDKQGMALVYSNLSNAQLIQSNFSEAEKYSLKALRISRSFKPTEISGTIFHNYGSVLHKLGKPEDAKKYLDTALFLKKNYSAEREWISTYASIAFVYQEEKNYPVALNYFDSALILARKIDFKHEISQQLTNIAEINLLTKNYSLAQKNLDFSYEVARRLDSGKDLSRICSLQSQVNAAIGNKNAAFDWLQKHIVYKDQLFNEKNREFAIRKSLEYEQNIKRETDSLQNAAQLQQIEFKRLEEKSASDKRKQMLYAGLIILSVIAFFLIIGFARKSKINRIITKEKKLVEKQKNIIETQRNEIVDSINYAKRMQRAMLPTSENVKEVLKEAFVLYMPKDQLSGDFYFVGKVHNINNEEYLLFSVADCTGHGVPGAMMSVIGIIYLQLGQRMREVNSPAEALDLLNNAIYKIFDKDDQGHLIRDGMDMVMGAIHLKSMKLIYAAAKNSLLVVRENKVIELKGDRFPLGKGESDEIKPFGNHSFSLQKGDIIYAATDGFSDQFGGTEGKKYKSKKLMNFLVSIHHLPMAEQKLALEKEFQDWKGKHEQVDDICLMGIKV